MKKDKRLHLFRRLAMLACCAVALGALWALGRFPSALETLYARPIGARLTRMLAALTSQVPFSLAEAALLLVTIYVIAPPVLALRQILTRQRSPINAVVAGSLRLFTAAVCVFTFFYVTWGFNYARAPLASRLGWSEIAQPADAAESTRQTDEIASIARQLVEATNRSYREFAATEDLGRPSERPSTLPPLEPALDAGFFAVQQELRLEPQFAPARGNAKPVLASALMNHLRITGFYFPWTGEANYNRLEPAPSLPHTVAHEKSHQRGIAREDEASFLGYLVCASSDDPYTRYSGYLFAHQQLVGELSRRDRGRAREIAAQRIKGVTRDLEAIRDFWSQYEGTASRVSESVNNRYIRSQGDARGVAAYAASRNLIVLYARSRGGIATEK